jgi:hypothetical protein
MTEHGNHNRKSGAEAAYEGAVLGEAEKALQADIRHPRAGRGKKLMDAAKAEEPVKKTEEAYLEDQYEDLGLVARRQSRGVDDINAQVQQRMLARQAGATLGGRAGNVGKLSPHTSPALSTAEIMARVQENTAEKREAKLAGARAGGQKQMEKAALEAAEKQLGEALNVRQRLALKAAVTVAGDEALNGLAAIAQEMEEQMQKGGAMASFLIAMTYLIALIKDVLDGLAAFSPGQGMAVGVAFGLVLTFFWIMICGSWHGGVATNWVLKRVLTRILAFSFLDGIPLFGIVPLYFVLNFWSHWDLTRAMKKSEEELMAVGEELTGLERDIRREVESI